MTRTGGYIYNARIIRELRLMGKTVLETSLPDGFPSPSPDERKIAQSVLLAVPRIQTLLVDGLAFGALGQWARELAQDRKLIALVHHPLALETGLHDEQVAKLTRSEASALRYANHVIVTSATTARILVRDFGANMEHITIAVPGHDPKPIAPASGKMTQILAVGSVTPRKDFASLIAALDMISTLPWRLTIAGSLERDPECAAELMRIIDRLAWRKRVTLAGEVDGSTLDEIYANSHIFVSSSRFEGYGMAMMDAIGFGLPVIAVAGGAVGDVLPKGAHLLVQPGSPRRLGEAIASFLRDKGRQRTMTDYAIQARDRLPGWRDSAALIAKALQI